MLDANVMWELGLRHAWRRSGTILIAPSWVKNPFDVARVPLHPTARAHVLSDGSAALQAAVRDFRRAAGRVAPQQKDSASRQLSLMRAGGDPADVIDPFLAFFD